MVSPETNGNSGVSLSALVFALDSAVRDVSYAALAEDSLVGSVALIEASDLLPELRGGLGTDLILAVGTSESLLVSWLVDISQDSVSRRPVALLVKENLDTQGLRQAAAQAAVALIVIDSRARWDVMLELINGRIERNQPLASLHDVPRPSTDVSDLFELAELIADGTGGMVTIEDATEQRVLAYSSSGASADDQRVRTILGRTPGSAAMNLFRKWRVMEAIRTDTGVVSVPEAPDLGMQPRLAAGIHSSAGAFLGSIWVQRAPEGFLANAEEVVRGAAVTASGILLQDVLRPSAEEVMMHRIFGEHGGLDGSAAAAYLGVPVDSPAAVIGIAANSHESSVVPSIARLLLLRVKGFSADAAVANIDSRNYVLLPSSRTPQNLTQWVEQLIYRFDDHPDLKHAPLRAAIAAPVHGLDAVASARREVDLVLDSATEDTPRVTTLAQSRTAVLLAETLRALSERSDLKDPRLAHLVAYDTKHATDLIASIRTYLDTGNNARQAARLLNIHPNTLHYRLDRARKLSGLDLNNPEDRLLTTLQLAVQY